MRFPVVFLALVIGALWQVPSNAQTQPQAATINLQGHGEVASAPDMATITSGVVTEGRSAAEALADNNAAMADLFDVLGRAGIAEKDIQTSGFSVQPQYVYSDKRDANGNSVPPTIVGYQVSNSVSVRVLDLDALGPVLDQMVSVGANSVSGVSFGVKQDRDLYDDARRLAMADVIAKGELYAQAAGISLGRILNISENSGYQPQPMAMAREMSFDAANKVPVMGGELTFAIDVSVGWEIAE